MAKTSMKVKCARKNKFAVREYTRCERCGRPHAVYRKFKLCRVSHNPRKSITSRPLIQFCITAVGSSLLYLAISVIEIYSF